MNSTPALAQLSNLTNGWMAHFASADREIEWLGAELELSAQLDERTLLLGRIDTYGRNAAGQLFFGEWKTANPRERNTWKTTWRMNPQSLTYGVLMHELHPDCHTFTVRKAFKSPTPSYDHAWFLYSDEELAHWRGELLRIAAEIRAYQASAPRNWPTNFDACFKWGSNNACAFLDKACSVQDFSGVPIGATPRVSHLESERRLNGGTSPEGLVVLDATRVKEWLTCRELYRRKYVDNIAPTPGEALVLGIEFHDVMGSYYSSLVKEA